MDGLSLVIGIWFGGLVMSLFYWWKFKKYNLVLKDVNKK